MFQEMRRKDRALSESEAREVIARSDFGQLATHGSDGWPYSVAINHVLENNTIYFPCAKKGPRLWIEKSADVPSLCWWPDTAKALKSKARR